MLTYSSVWERGIEKEGGARSMRAVADERTCLLGKDGGGRPHIRMCSLNARGEGLHPYCPQKGWEKEAMLSGRHAALKMPIHAPLEGGEKNSLNERDELFHVAASFTCHIREN